MGLFSQLRLRLSPSWLYRRNSFSQCGEDLIVSTALSLIKKGPYKYLDVGANDPFVLSNTALFYRMGGSGILVEPNPMLARRLEIARGNRDNVFRCGIGASTQTEADFYIMDSHVLSTFSAEEAARYEKMGHKIVRKMRIPLMDINSLLQRVEGLDFMNLDVEGLDGEILRRIDWHQHRPACICVETLTYENNRPPEKLDEIIHFMREQEYFVFADTFINTIFVDRKKWGARFQD